MAKRRGFFRRIVDAIRRPEKPDAFTWEPYREDKPEKQASPARPDKALLINRAYNNIRSRLEFIKESNIKERLRLMSIDELTWTIRADTNELRVAASQYPDRDDDDGRRVNPWWYK